MTTDQVKTCFLRHLNPILSPSKNSKVIRSIREAKLENVDSGRDPLTRHDIHTLALKQDREEVVEQAKIRVEGIVSLSRILVKDKLGNR